MDSSIQSLVFWDVTLISSPTKKKAEEIIVGTCKKNFDLYRTTQTQKQEEEKKKKEREEKKKAEEKARK